jgi:hypothetical protein
LRGEEHRQRDPDGKERQQAGEHGPPEARDAAMIAESRGLTVTAPASLSNT